MCLEEKCTHSGWMNSIKQDSSRINNHWWIFLRGNQLPFENKAKPFSLLQSMVNGSKSQLILIVYIGKHWCFSWQARGLYDFCEHVCVCLCVLWFSRWGRSWGQSCGLRSGRAAGPSRGSGCPAGPLVCSCGRPSGRPSLRSQARWARQPTGRTEL